jgi:hypothetical protein
MALRGAARISSWVAVVAACSSVVCAAPAALADEPAIKPTIEREERKAARDRIPEDELDERLELLEDRIATQRLHAEIWWWGWTAFYGGGAIAEGSRSIIETDNGQRAVHFANFLKATTFTLRLFLEPVKGIQELEPAPARQLSYSERMARLRRGERILAENALHTQPFGPWFAHLINAGVQGLGVVIVGAGFDEWEDAAIYGTIGFAIGEAAILTQPWEADGDLEEYWGRYGKGDGRAKQSAFSWTIKPYAGGAMWSASF